MVPLRRYEEGWIVVGHGRDRRAHPLLGRIQSPRMYSYPVRCRVWLLVIVAMIGGGATVWPQSRSLPDAPGTWKPWKPLADTGGARKDQAFTPALMKAFEGELLVLNAILRRAPGVTTPVGFSVETWGYMAGYHVSAHAPGQPAGAAMPIAGGLTFGAFPIFEYERNGKMVRQDTGETALQQFLVNQIGHYVININKGNVMEWGPVDTDAFLQPLPQGEIAGLPRYGDALVIARDPAALWTPLSQRGALDVVVEARRLRVGGHQESVDAAAARLAVVRDPAWRATRLKDAQQDSTTMPNPQAFIKQIEESIRIEETALLNELGPAAGSGKELLDAKRALSEVTDSIAGLSPAEQAAPACYAEKGTTLRAKFRTAASTDCHPLVRPNYGYFNKAVPRSAPQVLIITGITRCFDAANKYNLEANSRSPAGCRANRALIETLDTAAIRAWVR